MPHFYVLRANREAGPFTPAELKAYGLAATDLLWVDGESKEWKHPAEIDGLKAIAFDELKKEPAGSKDASSPAAVLRASNAVQQPVATEKIQSGEPGPSSAYPGETYFSRTKKYNAVTYTVGARLFGVVVLAIGLFLCGFVVVNMLKQLDAKPAAASEAVEIPAEVLPASNVAHTAEAPQPARPLVAASGAEKKDTALHEVSLQTKPLKTSPGASTLKAKKVDKTATPARPAQADDYKEAAPPQITEEKPEPVKPVTQAPSLQLSANDYKVGLFGGISNLEITVTNPSGQSVAKAVVEVEYLKPNGNVVRTQTVTAEDLAPGGSKTIPVPSSSRGVKVRYHMVSAE